MDEIPQKIYLQLYDDDGERLDDEITWCVDQINPTDVEYVPAAALAALRSENERLADAWAIDETIQADGSLRPSLADTLKRLEDCQRERDAMREALRGMVDMWDRAASPFGWTVWGNTSHDIEGSIKAIVDRARAALEPK